MRAPFIRLGISMIVGLSPIAGGCMPTSSHSGQDLSNLDEFKIEKGKTTEKELVNRFGPPAGTVTRGDGTKILNWSDTGGQGHINMMGAFLPFVPTKTVDVDSTSKPLSATVRDGVVIDYTISGGHAHHES